MFSVFVGRSMITRYFITTKASLWKLRLLFFECLGDIFKGYNIFKPLVLFKRSRRITTSYKAFPKREKP